ncbi:MAG: hypothetical protein QXM43_06645 [Desulfurococcaceae archaeon]
MSRKYPMVIFVGPQGAGKTTHARFLSRELRSLGYDVRVTSLIEYTVFHLKFIGLLNRICKTNIVTVKFYADLPPQPSASPEIYRRLFSLLILLHFTGYLMSLIKYRLLRVFHRVLIEHEGFIFKQIADLHFMAGYAKVKLNSVTGRLLKRFNALLLSVLLKDRVIVIRLEADISSLQQRYIGRPHIEPAHYLSFQNTIYEKLLKWLSSLYNIKVLNINSDRRIVELHSDIFNFIYPLLRS